MSLSCELGVAGRDDADFGRFECWDGDPAQYWAAEVENYVRGSVLRHAKHVLAFRDADDRLAAVSAFDERVLHVPLVNPSSHPAWHLQVVAVRIDLQGQRLADEVFSSTFAYMRSTDPQRDLLTANVHESNMGSRKACARHGLDTFVRLDGPYWMLLGEVP